MTNFEQIGVNGTAGVNVECGTLEIWGLNRIQPIFKLHTIKV